MEKQHILVKMKSDDTELEFGNNIVTITVNRAYWVEKSVHNEALKKIGALKAENKANLLSLNDKIDEKNTKIIGLQKSIEFKQTQVTNAETQIARLELDMEKKRNDIEILESDNKALGATVSSLKALVREKDNEIAGLVVSDEVYIKQLNALRKTIADLNDENSNLKVKVAFGKESREENRRFRAELKERDIHVDILRKDAERMRVDIVNYREIIKKAAESVGFVVK